MSRPTLYLMLGYPGAGKTTTAEILAKLTGATHLASDKIRTQMFPNPQFTTQEHAALYKALDEKTEKLLSEGTSVIYDANLNRHVHRQDKYNICKKVGATPLLLWIQTPESLSKTRAVHESRSHLWPTGEKPDSMFDRLVGIFEPPTHNEHYIQLDGTKISDEYLRDMLQL